MIAHAGARVKGLARIKCQISQPGPRAESIGETSDRSREYYARRFAFPSLPSRPASNFDPGKLGGKQLTSASRLHLDQSLCLRTMHSGGKRCVTSPSRGQLLLLAIHRSVLRIPYQQPEFSRTPQCYRRG